MKKVLFVIFGILCGALAYGAQNSSDRGCESTSSVEIGQPQDAKARKQMILEAASSVYDTLADKEERRLMRRLIRGIKNDRLESIMRNYTLPEAEMTAALWGRTRDRVIELYPGVLTPEQIERSLARFRRPASAAVASDVHAVREFKVPEINLDNLAPSLDYQMVSEQEMLDLLLKYLAINSGSIDPQDDTYPMTPGQEVMAALLKKDAEELGAKVVLTPWQYVYVDIPSNIEKEVPVIGISCHLDFNTETYGANITYKDIPDVHPIVIEYKGGDIEQSEGRFIKVDSEEGADLPALIGHTLIHTDGTTVLGGDDKNGCAIAMSLIKTLLQKNVRHGRVQLVFAPNEDIGAASLQIDSTYFNPDILIDVDGQGGNEVMAANFTAKAFNVEFIGHNAYPGDAKRLKLGDALAAASTYLASVPVKYRPERTEGYEGYIHPFEMREQSITDAEGNLQKKFIVNTRIRYFDSEEGELFDRLLRDALDRVSRDFPYVKYNVIYDDKQYDNVAVTMNPVSYTVLGRAAARTGQHIEFVSVRAGTTAAMFATKGLNAGMCLFSGQHNDHTVKEYSSLEEIMQAYYLLLYTIDEVTKLQ